MSQALGGGTRNPQLSDPFSRVNPLCYKPHYLFSISGIYEDSKLSIDTTLYTPKQAAEFFGVTPGTLSVWRSVGRYQIPYIKVGSSVRYRLEDLEGFLQERTRIHTGQGGAL
jgi:hypothetical protein